MQKFVYHNRKIRFVMFANICYLDNWMKNLICHFLPPFPLLFWSLYFCFLYLLVCIYI